jgi:hypothetical protein
VKVGKVMESHVKERKNGVDFMIFLSPQVINLLTITKLLIAKPPLDQSQKSKLKP